MNLNTSENYKYLDLLSRKLDPAQKEVCCRTENSIIAAGAGSGKTQVLATRFAWLVMSKGIPATKILTLTFTKKASAEMYSRIYETLKFFAQNPNTPSVQKQNAQKALEDFSEVHIQTLDSYCAKIVQQGANRYGIRPDFGNNTSTNNTYLLALQFALKNRHNHAIKFFLKNSNFEDFVNNYFVAITNYYTSIADDDDFFSKKLPLQMQITHSQWNILIDKILSILTSLMEAVDSCGAEITDPFFIKLKNLLDNSPEFSKVQDYNLFFQDKNARLCTKQIAIFCDKISTLTSNKRSGAFVQAKQAIKELKTLNSNLQSFANFVENFDDNKEFLRLLDEFASEIRTSKRLNGNLSFTDINEMALKILMEQQDIRTQEKQAYSKIMIDEFQDNNSKNRDLLFLISENLDSYTPLKYNSDDINNINSILKPHLDSDKLFFVGDEKQSIYKFRGADVSVFNQLTQDLNTQPIKMVYNYRSNEALLSSFNQIFGGFSSNDASCQNNLSVFSHTQNVPFEATYSETAIAKKIDTTTYQTKPAFPLNKTNIKTHVCMYNVGFNKSDSQNIYLSEKDQVAYYIALSIKNCFDNLPPQDKKYSSFAILDPKRSGRANLLRWLTYFAIPYNLDQQGDIFQEAIINDFYNFLRLCVYPSDQKAFAGFLTSPFAGLSIDSMQNILSVNSDTLSICTDLKQILPAVEYEKYTQAINFFTNTKAKILSQPITTSLSYLWHTCGYRFETLKNQTTYLLSEHFDLLYELARQADVQGQSIAWFIDQLAVLKFNYSNSESEIDLKEINYPLEKKDAINIMTIHKSKGLQFKYVYIYDFSGRVKNPSEKEFYFDSKYGLSFKPSFFFNSQKELENSKELEEKKRTFYVAATRAEDSLFIVGSWEQKKETSTAKKPFLEDIILSYYPESQNQDFIQNEYKYVDDAPFDFLSIQPVEKNIINQQKNNQDSNFLKIAQNLFEKNPTIFYQEPESIKKTPSSLEGLGSIIPTNKTDNYKDLTSLIQNYCKTAEETAELIQDSQVEQLEQQDLVLQSKDFNYADFGTLAHLYLQAQIQGIEPFEFVPQVKLFKNLTPEHIEFVKSCCINMCKQFKNSNIGKQVFECINKNLFYKAEYAFRMFYNNNIFTGSIDLIFQTGTDSYKIVDYKTDQTINTEKYIEQQNCYRQAASKLLNVAPSNIELCLYFLRFDQEVVLK